jgi:hypothetical protein
MIFLFRTFSDIFGHAVSTAPHRCTAVETIVSKRELLGTFGNSFPLPLLFGFQRARDPNSDRGEKMSLYRSPGRCALGRLGAQRPKCRPRPGLELAVETFVISDFSGLRLRAPHAQRALLQIDADASYDPIAARSFAFSGVTISEGITYVFSGLKFLSRMTWLPISTALSTQSG